uniref:Uncharacterized protein n=1 Tax=Thermosporothrix sp. COM3 TaxID=2490863 RepID=A0A455SS26_9CHLR|nr:hypothetical protein KTC_48790 [Thermosporothrix sp. COM3]BBH90193.1 hypothetical protein KTC_49440 [Thermosporothrix sp. COM3]BBH90258.1 hypothetical protein KTC_50090 [Thermosporothrix sp. COM3]
MEHNWRDDPNARRLRTHLQRCVPPRIRDYLRKGGPTPEDIEQVRGVTRDIARAGDLILYPDGTGREQPYLDELVEAVALLAFAPGGITVMGLHFDATIIAQEAPQDELTQLLSDIDSLLSL